MKTTVIACLLSFALGYAVAVGGPPLPVGAAHADAARERTGDRDFQAAVRTIAERETRRILKDCRINGYVEGTNLFGRLDC